MNWVVDQFINWGANGIILDNLSFFRLKTDQSEFTHFKK